MPVQRGSISRTEPHLSEPQFLVLYELAQLGVLTTGQIQTFILSHLPPRTAYYHLERLRALGLVRAIPLHTQQGHQELGWSLRPAGAHYVAKKCPHRHYPYRARALTPDQIMHQTTMLMLIDAIRAVRWAFVRPAVYNAQHPKPAQTEQSEAIAVAVGYHFEHTPKNPRSPGELPPPALHPSNVPERTNDWVAFDPVQPQRCVGLILHPPNAGRKFWVAASRPTRRSATGASARIRLYADVAPILPVLAVFPDGERLAEYSPLFRQTAIRPCLRDDLARFFRALAAG